MNNIQACGDDDIDMDTDGCEDGDDSYEYVPPTPKEQFQGLIALIQRASSMVESAYGQMIEQAAPFDKELVKKLEGAKKADLELFEYVRSKAEQGQPLPQEIISGLLGR